jgi:hypothetical protein
MLGRKISYESLLGTNPKDLYWLSSEDFKTYLLARENFPLSLKDEVVCSNMSYLHIVFGIVPDGMSVATFNKILRLENFFWHRLSIGPFLPIVQESWNGAQVSEWLIRAKIVHEPKRSLISENLDGRRFLLGQVHDVLSEHEIKEMILNIQGKAYSLARNVWNLSRPSHEWCFPTRRFFNIYFDEIESESELRKAFARRYSLNFAIALKPGGIPEDFDPELE